MKPRPRFRYKAELILTAIKEAGGMRARDIQKLIWELNHPGEPFTHAERGYYCTPLYGTGFSDTFGLLEWFCTQLPDGTWIVTEPIAPPFYRPKHDSSGRRVKVSKTLQMKIDMWQGERARREDEKPECPSCRRKVTVFKANHVSWAPEKQAHIVSWAYYYVIDCKGVVWFREEPDRANLQRTDLTREETHRLNHRDLEIMRQSLKERVCS